MLILRAFPLLASALICCSGKTVYSGTPTGGSAGALSVGGGGATPPFSSCPTEPPATSAPCAVGLDALNSPDCTWGADPRAECRITAKCKADATWLVTPRNSALCAVPSLPAACPSSPMVSGEPCGKAGQPPDSQAMACWYSDGRFCECSSCQGAQNVTGCQTVDPPQWICRTPPPGCPPQLPQAGTSCDPPQVGLSCSLQCDVGVSCETDGKWHWQQRNCPTCAAPDTPIATPTGEHPIAQLRIGDLVYSMDHGAVVVVPIARVGKTHVTAHHVMRITLDTGAVLQISPGHPTADGRIFSDLRAGVALDPWHAVQRVEVIAYSYDSTYDILPASETGTYFAAGVLIGSTLGVGDARGALSCFL